MYERIKALCKQTGTTIKQLEKELGLGNGAIAKWQVSSPKGENLVKIANYFGISVDYLLGNGLYAYCDFIEENIDVFRDAIGNFTSDDYPELIPALLRKFDSSDTIIKKIDILSIFIKDIKFNSANHITIIWNIV